MLISDLLLVTKGLVLLDDESPVFHILNTPGFVLCNRW